MYDSKLKSDDLDILFETILNLKNEDECYMFFEDLCTISELNAITQRYKVARLLSENITSQAIADETGASTATISRVNRCLNYGAGGYQLAIEREKKEDGDKDK